MPLFRKYSASQSGLFEKKQAEKRDDHLIAHIDGGARGNPGPAGYGVVVKDSKGKKLAELSRFLGRRTNNYAEYSALLAALQYSLEVGCKALQVYSDSELLVKQMRGEYKMRSPDLRPLFREAQTMLEKLEWFRIAYVPREQNREADHLANQAMDGKED